MSIKRYKVLLLGGAGVGKSGLTYRMIHSNFEPDYDPSTQDVYAFDVVIDEKPAFFLALDPKGDERTCLLLEDWLYDADAYVLVYSVGDKASLAKLKNLYGIIEKDKQQPTFNLIVVGNKSDLSNDKRQVKTEEGKQFADDVKCPYYECSAKEDKNCKEIFSELGRMCRKATGNKLQYKVDPNNPNAIPASNADKPVQKKKEVVEVVDLSQFQNYPQKQYSSNNDD